jgi:hypothetical protein
MPSFKLTKMHLSFVLSLIALLGVLALAWYKGVNLDILLPSILGIYIVGKSVQKMSGHWAASKDPNANTTEIIEKLEDRD